eukprot:6414431-Amphidinium_carterae.1
MPNHCAKKWHQIAIRCECTFWCLVHDLVLVGSEHLSSTYVLGVAAPLSHLITLGFAESMAIQCVALRVTHCIVCTCKAQLIQGQLMRGKCWRHTQMNKAQTTLAEVLCSSCNQ